MAFEARLQSEDGRIALALDGQHTVGRSEECELTLEDGEVSRRHAQLSVDGEQVFIEDLGSANGTRVNGQPISTRIQLKAGDTLHIGTTHLRLLINGQGATSQEDATVIAADDATVLAAGTASTAAATPGAWQPDEGADKTQFISNDGGAAQQLTVERQSTAPHLVIVDATGAMAEVLELTLDEGETVWEIGRDEACDIQLNDPTVSGRHAQLQHRDGRWRAVNLISSNGLVVNGERRLTVYLSDGDHIALGNLGVVFFAAESATRSSGRRAASGKPQAAKAEKDGAKSLKTMAVIAVLLAVAGAAAAGWWFAG